jgi:UDP-N-acetylglucosamine/UDP-N-acetylgalactosamine 4-epimerase
MTGNSELQFDDNIKILVTGCAGFIGSNLLEFFLAKGLCVRGIDNFSTGFKENIDDSILEASEKKKRVKFDFIDGDIRDYRDCLKSTKGIDIVFHEAALGSVQRSIEKPIDSNSSNVDGTINLLKASQENKVKRFIYASSSSVYGDSDILPKSEEMCPNPKSIYAVTKLTAEYYCRLFYNLYGLETVSLRYFNVFGKRQNPNSIYSAVIPIFIKNIFEKKPVVIYGDGKQSRDFTYIENVIEANARAALARDEAFGGYFNIACGTRICLKDLYDRLVEYAAGKKINPVYKEARKGDVKHSEADIKKAKTILKYNPAYTIEEGLKLTVQWFKEKSEINTKI